MAERSREPRPDRHPADEAMRRFRAHLAARDDDERALYREWRSLDRDDRASAIEERLMPEQAYERYEGPLGWSAFLTEYRAGLPTDAADDVPDLADDPVGLAHIANPRPAQDAVASPSRSSPPAGPARALRGALESIRRGRGGR